MEVSFLIRTYHFESYKDKSVRTACQRILLALQHTKCVCSSNHFKWVLCMLQYQIICMSHIKPIAMDEIITTLFLWYLIIMIPAIITQFVTQGGQNVFDFVHSISNSTVIHFDRLIDAVVLEWLLDDPIRHRMLMLYDAIAEYIFSSLSIRYK